MHKPQNQSKKSGKDLQIFTPSTMTGGDQGNRIPTSSGMNTGEFNNLASRTALISFNGDGSDKFDFRKHTKVGVRTAAFSKINCDGKGACKVFGIPRDQMSLLAKSNQQEKK